MRPDLIKQKFKNIYRASAYLLLNTVICLLAVNFIILAIYRAKDAFFAPRQFFPELSSKFNSDGSPVKNGKRTWFHDAFFDRNAFGPEHSDQEIGEILDETHDYENLPKSYLGMGIIELASFNGKHLKVLPDSVGVNLRWTPTVDRPKSGDEIKIFALGGSTTYGYYVSDKDTWPSQLDVLLNKGLKVPKYSVYNYGRPGADLFDELAMLITLLEFGQKPDLVVFLDGLNGARTFDRNNFGQAEIRNLIEKAYLPATATFTDLSWIKSSGFFRLTQSVRSRLRGSQGDFPSTNITSSSSGASPEQLGTLMANSYLLSKAQIEGITEKLGIKTLFFLQPDVLYNYPHHLLRNPIPNFYSEERKKIKTEFYSQLKSKTDSISLLELFSVWGNRKAIIDDCHYSPDFARFIAGRMVPYIKTKSAQPLRHKDNNLAKNRG